jgi:hypothetical protein
MGKTKSDPVPEQARSAQMITDVSVGLSLRLAQLQVLGLGLAHVAHDAQNHLAIISESAGLMGDLLKLKTKQGFRWICSFLKRDKDRHLDVKPFFEELNTIREQVAHGSSLTQRLSSFAHRLEETVSVFDGNKALEEIQDVLSKQAGEKGIRLEIKLAREATMIETNPTGFQLAVFSSVEKIMEGLEGGNWLVLETETVDSLFHVRITSPGRDVYPILLPEGPDGQDFYRDIVEDLGGQIRKESDDRKYVTTLAFSLKKGET